MSLLEDFKRYADREIDGGRSHADGDPRCACTLLPSVVAALEAAERVVARARRPDTDQPGRRGYVAELRALAAALKGETA
jgi:hypothetical protein